MIPIYPDDRVLVAVMNNKADWQRVLTQNWYRIPTKHAPPGTPHFDWLAFYFTKAFGSDKWAIHYYAPICGHELVTRRDLIPTEPDHKRAGHWYYRLELGSLQHKIPPVTARTWKRITFIVTTGDRFELATDIRQLFAGKDGAGCSFVTLKEDSPADW